MNTRRSQGFGRWVLSALAIALVLLGSLPQSAAADELPPTGALTYLQTNGPLSPLGRGDWYTNTATAGAGAGYHYVTISVPCTTGTTWTAGQALNFDIFSADMNTADALADEDDNGTPANTTFELYGPGTVVGPGTATPAPGAAGTIFAATYAPGAAPDIWRRFRTIAAPVACGQYVLRSQARDDDQNAWRLRVGFDNDANPANTPPANYDNPDGLAGTNDEISIGIRQTSFQHDQATAGVNQCLTLFEYVAPGLASITFNNFDMDGNQRTRYYAPSATYDATATTGGVAGTLSIDSSWNGGGIARGGDTVANPESGWWRIVTCVGNHNQYIQEGQTSASAYYEQPPTPRMDVGKSDGIATTSPGNIQTYTIAFTNTSNATATPGAALNVVIQDTLPANVTFQSCAAVAPLVLTSCAAAAGVVTANVSGALNAGASGAIRITVQVNAGATGNVVNTVSLGYQDGLGNSFAPDTASDTDVVGGAIGNRVWNDVNQNGIQDAGEPNVAGVTVRLLNAAGAVIATTTTDASGNYSFANLALGDYRVQIGDGTTLTFTGRDIGADTADSDVDLNGISPLITIASGTVNQTIDAGIVYPGAIGDRLWYDLDGDGVQDAGEPGIANVDVELRDATNALVATVRTDANGNYWFTGVAPGTYSVDVVNATLPAGLTLHPNLTDPRAGIVLAANQIISTVDFGYINTAASAIIGDFVWSDADNDGAQDPGERGIGGVTVILRTPGPDGIFGTGDDVAFLTTTTAADGSYRFSGVPAGEYRLDVTGPGGYALTSGPQSNTDPSAPFTVRAGDIYLNGDFGYRNAALIDITDRLWIDADGDGVLDAGETPIPGVTVSLIDNATGLVVATTTSDATGAVSFPDVGSGSYSLRVTDLNGAVADYTRTTSFAMAGVRNLGAITTSQTLTSFGYLARAAIGDTVFNDIDNDGVQDAGERGLSGVTVQLFADTDGDGVYDVGTDLLVETVATDANGAYLFPNLPAGRYFTSIDPTQAALAGWTLTTADNETAAGHQRDITITGTTSVLSADYGYRNVALPDVSGNIWNDIDRDGLDDGATEPPLAGIVVTLVNSSGTVIATTTTAADGSYSFPDVPAGNYTVRVPQQAGLSGYDLTSGLDYTPITVAAANITNINFGYARQPQTGSIGDFVWSDADRDGVQDGGEGGISNVLLTLVSAGPDGIFGNGDDVTIGTTRTDQNGFYRFNNLASGLYRVDLDATTLPAGGAGFVATAGTSDPTGAIALSPGEAYARADFGYGSSPTTSLLGDRVWFDTDGDGAQDVGEPGIAGVQLTITGPSGPFVVTTRADGTWIVPNLAPGTYTVAVNPATLPAGVSATPTNPGPISRTFTLTAGRDILYADFGFAGGVRGSIGDLVWNDADGDGVLDAGEQGIAGVSVNLIGPGPNGTFGDADDVILATTTTAANGAYGFTGLSVTAGSNTYRVQPVDRNGVLQGLNTTTPAVATTTITLTAATPNNTAADFGYQPASTAAGGVIGNQVWRDIDADGFRDSGEPGVEGVTINLWRDVDGNGVINPTVDNLVRTTATDSRGYYEFAGLPLGAYLVDVTDTRGILAGYTKTAGSANTDDNSQADPYAVTLTAGAPRTYAADFGYRATTPFAISGTVFKDLDQDATLDATEPRFSRVNVFLYSDLDGDGVLDPGEPLIATTVTSSPNGDYAFAGAPNGRYIVVTDTTASGLAGTYQTTQTATGGVQPVFVNNANSVNNNFGYFAPDAPTRINLVSFTATRQSDGTVLVVWETAAEFNTAGFHILRATAGARDAAIQQNAALIPAQGDVSGFRYEWVDRNAPDTAAYSYWLQEVETGGALIEYGPANVLGATQFKVFAPLTFR